MQPLILMPCSAIKRPVTVPTRFVDVYDGPLWQQVRTYPADAIAAISAKHGLLMPGALIEPYDRLMDEQRLMQIINDGTTIKNLGALTERHGLLLLVVGSELYKFVGLSILGQRPDLINHVRFACGSYLQQRHALKQFLDFDRNAERAAA